MGLHAFVAVSHSGGQKHGRVLRLNTATGQLEQGLFRTNVARPLSVRAQRRTVCFQLMVPELHPHWQRSPILHGDEQCNACITAPGSSDLACPLQVSPGGAYVATFDKHSLHIWATRHAERKPLTLHHTKAFTVCSGPSGGSLQSSFNCSRSQWVIYAHLCADLHAPPWTALAMCSVFHSQGLRGATG